MDLITTVVVAIIYAVAPGASGSADQLGRRLEAEQAVPAVARGVLLPLHGVVQLEAGARARITARPGSLELIEGNLRLVADRGLLLSASGLEVTVGAAAEAVVTRGSGRFTVCAARGAVTVEGRGVRLPAEGSEEPAAGQSDIGELRIPVGQCWHNGGGAEGEATQLQNFDPQESARLRGLAESQAPPPLTALPDVVGNLSEHVAEVESQHGAALDSGPRREAQSCGCSEAGGSGGGLDPGGPGGPDPEPEQPDPGRVRVRIEIPRR